MQAEDDLHTIAVREKAAIIAACVQAFPQLQGDVEDLFHEVLLEGLEKARTEGFLPGQGWAAWLRWMIRNRALDRLRVRERELFSSWTQRQGTCGQPEVPDPSPLPSSVVAEQERRQRQGLLLSQVLAEFTRWCETRSDGFRMKTIYERRVRGESPEAIARELGLSRNTVDVTVKRAREWIYGRICQVDVDYTVFQTLHEGRTPPADRALPGRGKKNSPPIRPPLVGAPLPGGSVQNLPCSHASLADVVHWVVTELGAFCPSPERLAAYAANPRASEYCDVHYHVQRAACRICQTELGVITRGG